MGKIVSKKGFFMLNSKIPIHKQYLYEEDEIFGDSTDKLVDISIHENCHVGMHNHNFYEINIVLSGEGKHYIGDMSMPAIPGDIFIIPIGVYHGYVCTRELDVAHVILKNSFMERYYDELLRIPGFSALFEIEPYLRQIYDEHLFLHLDRNSLEKTSTEITDIISLSENCYESYKSIYTLRLLSLLSIEMQKQNQSSTSNENRDIFKVLEYIQAHYEEKILLEDLMAVANMSRPTLHRHFKAITQMTPKQYILKLRLSAVRDQLSRHTESKTQIAQKYGFFDTSHLNKQLQSNGATKKAHTEKSI